ncbi:MAG: IPT/TIG domain-containing protein [Patescibacteria group bacterium]
MANKKILLLAISFLFMPFAIWATYGDTATFVGEVYSGDGKIATNAYFDFPEDVCVTSGGAFYIADTYNHVIRKINKNSIVSTAAGTGSYGDEVGVRTNAEFAYPKGVGCDDNGNVVVADTNNNKIKKISGGIVSTLVDSLNAPEGVEIYNNKVYFLDTGNNALKSVSLDGSNLNTITSSLHSPKKMDIYNGYAYIVDSGNYNLVKVNLSNGQTQIIAGSSTSGNKTGDCLSSKFKDIWGVAVVNENEIFISDGTGALVDDSELNRGIGYLIKINLNSNCQTTVFAEDKNMNYINFPGGLALYNNNLYVASTGIGFIYRYNINDATDKEKFAGKNRYGDEAGAGALLGRPRTMVQYPRNSKYIYFVQNNKISRLNTKNKKVQEFVGNVVDNYAANDEAWYSGSSARFSDPRGMAFTSGGKYLYVADRYNNRIRVVDVKNKKVGYLTGAGLITTLGSDDNGYQEGTACANEFKTGVSECAYFNHPTGMAIDPKNKYLYITDSSNQVIRKVYLKGKKRGQTKLIAGMAGVAGFANGKKKNAKFNAPFAIAINAKGTFLYVADRNNQAIRKIRIRDGKVTTLAGDGVAGYVDGTFANNKFSYPISITWKNKKLYVSEAGSQKIRVMDLETNISKLVSGSGSLGYEDGSRKETEFNNPAGIVAKKNYLFVADEFNDVIRKINIKGEALYTEPAPEFNGCEPMSLKYSDYPTGYAMILITGNNFRYGTRTFFGSYEAKTYVQSATNIAVNVPIGQMAPGFYEVKVMNFDGQYDKSMRAFSAKEYSGNIPVIDYWTD